MKNLKFILPFLAVMLLLVSCGGKEYDSNTLVINKDLSINAVYISAFPTEKYNIDEMKTEIRESVDLYNESVPGAVSLKSCTLRDEKAVVEMEFASGSDYASFNNLDFYCGPLGDAVAGGFIDNNTEVSLYEDGTITTVGEIADQDGLMIIKTEEAADIEFKGKISVSYINKYVKIDRETGTICIDFEEDEDGRAVLIFSK